MKERHSNAKTKLVRHSSGKQMNDECYNLIESEHP